MNGQVWRRLNDQIYREPRDKLFAEIVLFTLTVIKALDADELTNSKS